MMSTAKHPPHTNDPPISTVVLFASLGMLPTTIIGSTIVVFVVVLVEVLVKM